MHLKMPSIKCLPFCHGLHKLIAAIRHEDHMKGMTLIRSRVSHKICTWFSCASFCCDNIIVLNYSNEIRDSITLWRHLSLAGCKPRINPVPISFKVNSLPLWQLYQLNNASEVTLRNMDKMNMYRTMTRHEGCGASFSMWSILQT